MHLLHRCVWVHHSNNNQQHPPDAPQLAWWPIMIWLGAALLGCGAFAAAIQSGDDALRNTVVGISLCSFVISSHVITCVVGPPVGGSCDEFTNYEWPHSRVDGAWCMLMPCLAFGSLWSWP